MKTKLVISISLLLILIGCGNKEKRTIEEYVSAINNSDTSKLEKLLSNEFTLTFLDSSYNKAEFKKTINQDKDLQFSNKLVSFEKLSDSIYITTESMKNIFQKNNDKIPPFERLKKYCIKDGQIKWIKSDTAVGSNETFMILNYVSTEFSSWFINQKSIIDTLSENQTSLENVIKLFYNSTQINKSIENKSYRKDKFIELVKNYPYQDDAVYKTFEKVFKKVAGLEGKVEWSSFKTKEYSNNPSIRVVEVTINRNKKENKYNNIKMQYLVNIENEYVELKYGEINGEPKSILDISMTISLLLSAGSYI